MKERIEGLGRKAAAICWQRFVNLFANVSVRDPSILPVRKSNKDTWRHGMTLDR